VEAGFRRINLGVQSLDPTLYAHHHFGEPLSVALDAIERARNIGFSYINIDLMTGLAGQTPTSWKLTLNTLKKLAESGAIDSVFIYPYHDDPRSSSFNKPLQLPDALETARTDAVAREMMESLGWSELGARFYRSPRHMRRELWELAKTRINPAYGEVLYHGFGNSSFSIGDRATWLNHRSLSDYCKAVEQHGLGISHFVPLTDAQRATRDLTFDLLYSPITRVRSRARKYGAEAMASHQQKLMHWEELGLGKHNRLLGTFSLTPLGKLAQLQLIPQHYLAGDHTLFSNVMLQRKEAGKKYRGY
jgi:coproporphyrinogen III oxidase-like Fe-S oxidoreductase